MEQNQVRLEAMVAANARQLATVSSQVYVNNNEVQENLQKLDRNDIDLAGGISTVQNQQGTLHDAVTTASQTLGQKMTSLDENQRHLQDGVAQVAGVTQKTAADVTAIAQEHATLHQMVQSSRKELGDGIAVVAANQDKTRTDIGQLQQRHQALADQLVALAASQDRIHSGLDGLNKLMQLVANDVTAVSQGQTALRQALDEHKAVFADKSAVLEQNQRNTQASVDGIAGQTKQNADGIAAVAVNQAALQQTLGANHQTLTGQVAAVIDNQQGLRADIRGLSDKTGQTAAQLTSLATGQDAIRETLRSGNEAVTAKLTGLSENQTGLKGELNGLHQKADTVVTGVQSVRTEQAGLRESVKANHETARDLMAQLSSGEQQIQNQLDALTSTAGQTALDVVALTDSSAAMRQSLQANTAGLDEKTDRIATGLTTVADRQTAMQQTIGAGLSAMAAEQNAAHKAIREQGEQLSSRAAASAENQQQFQNDVDTVLATAEQTALDVIALASQQDAMQQTIQNHGKAADSQMASLAAGQEQVQSGLDTITATTGQTALDVIGAAAGQDALRQNLQNHNEVVAGRIADLASSQQQTQSGLDTVVATAGQTALDVIALNDGQIRLAQAAQADRQELAAKLTGIVQSQQQWVQRLDAAQANVQTIAASIATLEQHITKLQGSLQPSLDGLTTQLGANGQGRAQFEAKVNQDVQAIAEAISQLRQDQATLTDQMQQIQKRTQSQTKDIITAIQQLKQPPAEVKISDSGAMVNESGTKLESSVAEAEAK
jgi:chromosome segregation ATPase